MNMTIPSKYLTKEDVDGNGNGTLVTITEVHPESMPARQGSPAETKNILFFAEFEKGMVLNKVNTKMLIANLNSAESSHWIGHKVVAWNNPDVTDLQGNIVGGIRLRMPRKQATAPQQFQQPARPAAAPMQQPRSATPPPDDMDDVPF